MLFKLKAIKTNNLFSCFKLHFTAFILNTKDNNNYISFLGNNTSKKIIRHKKTQYIKTTILYTPLKK